MARSELKCDNCGDVGSHVSQVLDPFELVISGNEVEVNLCDACYGNIMSVVEDIDGVEKVDAASHRDGRMP